MINTHLHFDHAGGEYVRRCGGRGARVLPERTVRGAEGRAPLGHAHQRAHRRELLPAKLGSRSSRPGRFDFIEGDREVVPGISVMLTPGHVPYHQSVLVDGGRDRLLPRRRVPDGGAPAAAVDHGVRRRAAADAGVEAGAARSGRRTERGCWCSSTMRTVAWGRVRHDGKAYGLVGDERRVIGLLLVGPHRFTVNRPTENGSTRRCVVHTLALTPSPSLLFASHRYQEIRPGLPDPPSGL